MVISVGLLGVFFQAREYFLSFCCTSRLKGPGPKGVVKKSRFH